MIRKSSPSKAPRKPRPDFPLFIHRRGYWAKKVKGETIYFGKVADDPQGKKALDKWLNERDDRLAGRKPREKTEGLELVDLVNQFLTAKIRLRDGGEITVRTYNDYYATCETVLEKLGKRRSVADLRPSDFEELRVELAKSGGPTRLVAKVAMVKGLFHYAWQSALIDVPIRFGPGFKAPSASTLRRHRAAGGPKMFEAEELRTLLAAASAPLKAMTLLGVNCGLGNNDCSCLEHRHLDLTNGWLNYSRIKTGTDRRAKLWPETVEAVRAAITERPDHKDAKHEERVFLTRCGAPWVSEGTTDNALAKEFAKVLKTTDLRKQNRGFYALRHTFATIASETGDQVATNFVMGHIDGHISARYRERLNDDRLERVAEHVRKWLFAVPNEPQMKSGQ